MDSDKKVLVTGANGHLGCNTVRKLISKGFEVYSFVRESSDLRGLRGLQDLQIRYGDITDKAALEKAAQGCDIIIHHAAVYKLWAKSEEEILAPAIEGTENLFQAASAAKIKKVIYTSSVVAVGTTESQNKVLNEQDWNDSASFTYAIAKAKSERLAWKLSKDYNIPMVALCPGHILGQYDFKITPSNRIIVDMMKGLGLTLNTSMGIVDVRDVADMHLAAIEKGIAGERYIVIGKVVMMHEIGALYKKLTNRFVPKLNTPRGINIFIGTLMDGIGQMFNWDPPLTGKVARDYSHRYSNYDNTKIVKAFGFKPIPFEQTVIDTIRWFLYLKIGKVSKKVEDNFKPDPTWG